MKGKEQLSFEIEEEKSKSDNKEEKYWKLEFYEEKNFKDTEIGPIPEDWEVVRLGEVLHESKVRNTTGEKLPVFSVSNTEGFVLSSEYFDKQVYSKDLKNYKIVKRNYFAYNPARINVGSIALYLNDNVGLVSPMYVVFKVSQTQKLKEEFLFLIIKSEKYLSEIKRFSKSRGSVRQVLLFTDLCEFSLPLPPLSEQKAIAEVLSTIQSAREKTEEVIKATKELKKSIMKHLFTYGPVPIDQIDKIKLKETEIGPIPEHWEVVRLGEVVLNVVNGDWGQEIKENDSVLCYVIRGTDFTNIEKRLFEKIPKRFIKIKSLSKRRIKTNDILVELSGGGPDQPTGRVLIVTNEILEKLNLVCFSNFVKKLEIDNKVVYAYYFYRYWQYIYGKGRTVFYEKRTTGIRNFKLNDFLEKEYIPLPPLAEQQKISEILQSIDEKIQKEEEKKKALDNLFKSMLGNLMSGKIRIKILEGD